MDCRMSTGKWSSVATERALSSKLDSRAEIVHNNCKARAAKGQASVGHFDPRDETHATRAFANLVP